jgi:uncharacterized DUF497 family protein
MPFSLFIISRLVAYPISQAVQSIGSTATLENRYYVLGRTNMNRLLFAVFTVRNDKIRIISARDMTESEIKRYPK